jgi:hypothetical protein
MALPEIYDMCEQLSVEYVIGIPCNPRLMKHGAPLDAKAKRQYEQTLEKVRIFAAFPYQAESWPHPRRIIAKSEIIPGHERDTNRRFVVTNRTDLVPEQLYGFYIQRGDVESRIDELKNDCQADRTSCPRFLANQFRLLMHLAAYILFVELRQRLASPELRTAQVETLRLRLIKLAARVYDRARHVVFSLAQNYPWIDDWLNAAHAVKGGM